MACVSCGYKKNRYRLCNECKQLICNQCISAGLCKDCFARIETSNYTAVYEYQGVLYEQEQ